MTSKTVVDIVFLCRDWTGRLRPQAGEVEALRFFPPERIPDEIMPPNRPALQAWLTKAQGGS